MSRSGYSDDLDSTFDLIKWRGQVASAARGKRGQRFFLDLATALDAMPEKRLVKNQLEGEGTVCALGCLGRHRGIPLLPLDDLIDEADYDGLGDAFGIAHQLAQETMWVNDDGGRFAESPEERWTRVRTWAVEQLLPETLLPEPIEP